MRTWCNTLRVCDALESVSELPDCSVQSCITSPPYFQLRDYGVQGQIGLEKSVTEYVVRLVTLFKEVKRVLKADGTVWLNLGDSYSRKQRVVPTFQYDGITTGKTGKMFAKTKDLLGIPWMIAVALRQDGWYLRQDIIWHKPNPLPESVRDRCTKAHEYLFLLTKSPKYLFNRQAIATPLKESTLRRLDQDLPSQNGTTRIPGKTNGTFNAIGNPLTGANRRSVWTITAKSHNDLHLATFPDELARLCILAGSNPRDIVLDPFVGRGTSVINARLLNRAYIGFDLNPLYVEIAREHLKNCKRT